jgi:hypothetical protein
VRLDGGHQGRRDGRVGMTAGLAGVGAASNDWAGLPFEGLAVCGPEAAVMAGRAHRGTGGAPSWRCVCSDAQSGVP